MPYATNSDLPKAARDAYSSKCQSVFRQVWNSEYGDHGDESRAFATAHAAAKRCQGGTKSMALEMRTFELYAPTLKASRSSDGKLRIEGIASSTIKDRHGDQLTLKALRKMESSAIGMTIFMNHEYKIPGDVFGTVEKARVSRTDDKDDKTGEPIYDLRFGIRVADSNPEAVKSFELIESDQVKLGLSIGAMVPEGGATFNTKTATYLVDDVDIVETSVIGIPANPRSWVDYVVKALAGRYPNRMNDEYREQLRKQAIEAGGAVEDEPDGEEHEHADVGEGIEVPLGATAITPDMEESLGDLLVEALEDGIDEEHFNVHGLDLEVKESWSTAYVNALPDSAFACPGSRKYPHHSKSGGVDIAHLRAALSRAGDEGNDQCGKAHLEAHARKLGLGDREKGLDLTKDGSGQHPHAHIHEHEHEHGYGNSKTVHNHEHAHVHSHEHEDDHEHASDQSDWQHNHEHEGSYGDPDHAHEGTNEDTDSDEKTEKGLEPDLTKSKVTIWESDGDVVEVNTGRSKSKSDGTEPAQTEKSETAEGETGSKTKSLEGDETEASAIAIAKSSVDGASGLLKAVYAQLKIARAENLALKKERDAAFEIAGKAVEGTRQIITKLGEMPMGRKTQFTEVQKGFDDLADIYDEEVRQLMTKSTR